MKRLPPHQIEPSTTDGDVLTTVAGKALWASGGGRYREVLMASGVTFPAEPLESSGGGDWLYGEATL